MMIFLQESSTCLQRLIWRGRMMIVTWRHVNGLLNWRGSVVCWRRDRVSVTGLPAAGTSSCSCTDSPKTNSIYTGPSNSPSSSKIRNSSMEPGLPTVPRACMKDSPEPCALLPIWCSRIKPSSRSLMSLPNPFHIRRVCMRACVRACVHACACVCATYQFLLLHIKI